MDAADDIMVRQPDDDGDASVVELTGEHDLSTVVPIRERIDTELRRGGVVIVDLSTTAFIDSSILGVILESRDAAREAGRRFAVAMEGGRDAVRRVLEVTGLLDELPVYPTLDAAKAALSTEG